MQFFTRRSLIILNVPASLPIYWQLLQKETIKNTFIVGFLFEFLLNFSFWKIMIYIKQISCVFIHLTPTLLQMFSLSQNLIHNKNEIVSKFLWIVFNFCSRLKKAVALDVKRWLLWFGPFVGPLQSLLPQIDADRGRRAKNSRYNCYALSVFRYTKIAAICKIYQNSPKK